MTSVAIGTRFTLDSQYFEIYNSQYIETFCIYSQYVNILFFALPVKDLYSTAPKRGSVFIGLMTPDGAIWSRHQRTVLMR